jgi:hypothetical protein
LPENTIQRSLGQIVIPVTSDCNNPLLERMTVLSVTAFRSDQNPAVVFQDSNDLSNLHRDHLNNDERPIFSHALGPGWVKLGLASFFTVGSDEVNSWTIREGTRAAQADPQSSPCPGLGPQLSCSSMYWM